MFFACNAAVVLPAAFGVIDCARNFIAVATATLRSLYSQLSTLQRDLLPAFEFF